MSIFGAIRHHGKSVLNALARAFTPKAPEPMPTERRPGFGANFKANLGPLDVRFWWRSNFLTPHMRHKLANDKGLMFAENPLLRGLIARHFKVS